MYQTLPESRVDVVWGLPRCVWARESTAPAQGNQSLSSSSMADKPLHRKKQEPYKEHGDRLQGSFSPKSGETGESRPSQLRSPSLEHRLQSSSARRTFKVTLMNG